MPPNSQKLPLSILNYFAAFTETKFNFKTLVNYCWTDDEFSLDLGLFQAFRETLLAKIKSGDNTPVVIKPQEHTISLPKDGAPEVGWRPGPKTISTLRSAKK